MRATNEILKMHMNELCEVIGARATGSEANKAAVQYAADQFKRLGYEVTLQEFSCMDWNNKGSRLVVGKEEIEVSAAEYSLPCNVNGQLVCVETIDQLKAAELSGKICVLHGELCKEPLMPKSMIFWNPEEHQEIIRELEMKKPLAVITVSFIPDAAVPIIQDGDFEIPCAAVKGELAEVLLNGDNADLQLMTERRPSRASNVIASYGAGKQKINFSAHIDTKPDTPGALDNASGAAVLLALAEKTAGTDSPYQIEFVLFNGEDYYSTPGEVAFMNTYLKNPENYICAVNVDGVGLKDSSTSYSFYEYPKNYQNIVDNLAGLLKNVEKIDPWPMGDHMLFAVSGIPAVAITAVEIFRLMETIMHTPQDNLSYIDYKILEEVVGFLSKYIETFSY